MGGFTYGRLGRIIILMVCYVGVVFGGFFDSATMYLSLSNNTPIITDPENDSDYKYTFGIRKIALFEYQDRKKFYTGDESYLSDKAIIGAVNGFEYLLNFDSARNRGNEFLDQQYWLKWSDDKYITKIKYVNKESRDLEFVQFDFRYRKSFLFLDYTNGWAITGHPEYGHPAIDDYEGMWWQLAYEYGFEDYTYPVGDINENGEIDSYYIWVETDPDTEEGYWLYWEEGTNYYWEDPEGNPVATSDEEFQQYHYPYIVEMYNENNKEKEWQYELHYVMGLDMYFSGDNYYSHIWINLFPKSYGITDKAYETDDIQYNVGALIGGNITDKFGLFLEGDRMFFYGREEYNVKVGFNYKF